MSETLELEPMSYTQTQHHETILIVEDEAPLLRLLGLFLDDAGYNVMSAKNGEEAVETYERHSGEIDLVVTDLGLPGLTGKDEVLRLEQINPEVRIICASGYMMHAVEQEMLRAGAKAIVSKPYTSQEVLQKVRSVLDSQI